MASRYEVEVKLVSASNLKNVNWRNGPNHPYAVVWVEPSQKCSTKADKTGDTNPNWDEKLVISLSPSATIEDSTLYVDVFHAVSEPEAKPIIIGSAKLRLEDVHNDVGIGQRASRTLKLKRPSGRPQGAVDIKVAIRDNGVQPPPAPAQAPQEFNPSHPPAYVNQYNAPPPTSNVSSAYTAPPIYSAPPPSSTVYSAYSAPPPTSNVSSVYTAPSIYRAPPPSSSVYTGYSAPPASGYTSAPPPSSTLYSGYTARSGYSAAPYDGQQSYGYGQAGQQSYGYGQAGQHSYGYGQTLEAQADEKKKSKFGLGTGLAVGAVAGGLGALALGKGVDVFEDKIADRAADKVEYDMALHDTSYDD